MWTRKLLPDQTYQYMTMLQHGLDDTQSAFDSSSLPGAGWEVSDAPPPAPEPSKAELALQAADAMINAQIRVDAATKLLLTYPDSAALKAHQKAAQDQVAAAVPTVTAAADAAPNTP